HDQNQSTETPDTAPSFVRVIGIAIVSYLVVACITYIFFYGFAPDLGLNLPESSAAVEGESSGSSQGSGTFPQSAYFRSSPSSDLIDPQVRLANLSAVADVTELATLLGTNPDINIILIDHQMLPAADTMFFQSRYANGDIIVGLRIPHAEMSDFLGIEPLEEGLTDEQRRDGVIWASVHYLEDDLPVGFEKSYDQFPSFIAELHAIR
ncbi:MAG: hypothetical protein AAF633_29080, partial [Chloroflexota bacterium]